MFGKMKKMSDLEKKAKLAALGGANKMATDALKGNLDGLKKVTVASDSKKGLKQGLDKAEELIGDKEHDMSSMMSGEDCPESEMGDEEHSDSMEDFESMDEEELDAKIEELMKLKEKLQSGEE